MQALTFYLAYPFIYAIALMPFRMLYIVSDVLCLLLKASGYRKKVIVQNLRNSFPEKDDAAISDLCNRYYRYLCDLTLETLKTIRMSERSAKKRCVFHNQPWLDQLYAERKSIMIVMGHHGNWEWAGPGFTLHTKHQLVVVYRPLKHPYFEKMMVRARTRFGTQITPVDKTLRDMMANQNKITATAFIADQVSMLKNADWMTFLNQETAIYTGYERLAQKFNYPVVYMRVTRVKRGYYEVTPELLFMNPKDTGANEIAETFMKKLEQDIIKDPVPWLWSHRRWKHVRKNHAKAENLVAVNA
ncbi:MAG TPA: lysophospholipid acyltransferase family protein [Chryseosolibacter sp.]